MSDTAILERIDTLIDRIEKWEKSNNALHQAFCALRLNAEDENLRIAQQEALRIIAKGTIKEHRKFIEHYSTDTYKTDNEAVLKTMVAECVCINAPSGAEKKEMPKAQDDALRATIRKYHFALSRDTLKSTAETLRELVEAREGVLQALDCTAPKHCAECGKAIPHKIQPSCLRYKDNYYCPRTCTEKQLERNNPPLNGTAPKAEMPEKMPLDTLREIRDIATLHWALPGLNASHEDRKILREIMDIANKTINGQRKITHLECPRCGSYRVFNRRVGDEGFLTCDNCDFSSGDDSEFTKESEAEDER